MGRKKEMEKAVLEKSSRDGMGMIRSVIQSRIDKRLARIEKIKAEIAGFEDLLGRL